MIQKRIGKIKSASFGHGGYQDACIGITFDLGSDQDSWGVHDFWGAWASERTDRCKWSEEDRTRELGDMVMRVNKILNDAKIDRVDRLTGVPVEVTFDANILKEWRVLMEAI